MIVIIFKLILIVSIWVLGLTVSTQQGMILHSLRRRVTDSDGKALRTIYDPLIVCHWCMPSMHTLIGYGFAFGLGVINFVFRWEYVLMYPLVVMGSSLVCGFTWSAYELMVVLQNHFSKAEISEAPSSQEMNHNNSLI